MLAYSILPVDLTINYRIHRKTFAVTKNTIIVSPQNICPVQCQELIESEGRDQLLTVYSLNVVLGPSDGTFKE